MAQTIKIKNSGTSGNTPSSLAHGELALNYNDGKLFYKNASGNIVEFTTSASGSFLPLSGGTLTGNLSRGDNVKAQFGAGNDLEIYHSGSDSFIADTGIGGLNIRGSDFVKLQTGDGAETMLYAQANGTVQLKYNNETKIETTSNGISVTSGISAESITLTGSGSSNPQITFNNNDFSTFDWI